MNYYSRYQKNIKLMFKVRFVVHDTSKQSPYSIRVVGNLPALGNWNPMNGFEMEEYYEGDWESVKQIEIPQGQEFQFKLVKLLGGNAVEWQQLPNNSNRKFKPKFNTKLVLKWSDHMGQALNEAKSSLKLQGLPGVMVNARKQGGLLKRNPPKNKNNILSDSDSENENDNDSFCVARKKSSDIRETMNSGDIQQIYYDTTELEHAYHSYKQIQVILVSNREIKKEFAEQIEQELKQLHELQNFKFRWLLLSDETASPPKFKRMSFKKVESGENGKIYLEEHATKNVQRNHFIFVDLDAALRTVVGNASACLYLPSEEFQKAIKYLKDLEKFQLICFDSAKANKNLLKIFQEKRNQNQKLEKVKLTSEDSKKVQLPKSEKNLDQVNLQKILEQLQFCQTETSVNTVHSFTRSQALANILKPNSILLIDSEIMKSDKKFFDKLLDEDCEKRLIIIIHKGTIPEWIHNFSQSKNICVILDNFTKLYFVGKLYDPSLKHRNAIEFIQMRARLFQKQFGGAWSISDNTFIFEFEKESINKATNIKAQIENVLMKDYNYFKFHMKENKLKITWNLSHPVRLLRTLVRIKVIEEGQMGNFYIVSQNENFNQLKEQLRLLINTKSQLMLQHKNTKIYDFGYGNNTTAKYSIKVSGTINCESTSSTSSNLSQKTSNSKMVQFLQKKYCRSSATQKPTTRLSSNAANGGSDED